MIAGELFYEKARELHQKYPVVDTHLDLAAEIYYRHRNGEREVIRRRYLDNFKKAGIRLVVSSVFLETVDLPLRGLQVSLDQIAALYEELEDLKEEMCLVRSGEEIQQALTEGKIGVLLYMEGLDVLTTDCHMLKCFYEMGVRGASLTWSRRNYLGDGCCSADDYKEIRGGLSELGLEAIQELEKMHMFVDVSHLNDDGFTDLARTAKKPYIASHSDARSVQDNYRNLTDDQIKTLAGSGGVIGINAYKNIVGAQPGRNGIARMCDHIQYISNLVGPEHVGVGLDLCDSYYYAYYNVPDGDEHGPELGDCLKNHSELVALTAELIRRGVPEEAIGKFLGENFIHYFCEILA